MEHDMNENIIYQDNKVSYEQRCSVLKQTGMVVWFTGLSGSGKSTIAIEVEKILNQQGKAVFLLDGDNIRMGINSDLGFSDADRKENIRRVAEVAALFQQAGLIVLCSFISPFHQLRQFAREKVGSDNIIEVYVSADIDTCMKRDPKGLYQKKLDNFTGISSVYEVPKHPDVIADTVNMSLRECISIVVKEIEKRY